MPMVRSFPCLAVLLLLALSLPAALPVPARAALRLNEILAGPARDWDGSGVFSSRDDEWLEVLNAGVTAVDLAGYFVTDADSIPRYEFSGTLPPGALALVTGKAAYDWERVVGRASVGLSLNNSGDSVLLWHVQGPDTVLVDGLTYRSHEAAADRAIGRSVDTGEWQLFDALNPYTGTLLPAGNRCAPSPGQTNQCVLTPTRATTWGRIKTLFD